MECSKYRKKTKVMRISRQPFPLHIILDQKESNNAEYFNYLGRIITNDARYTREIKPRMAMAKEAFNKKTLFATKLDLNLRMKLVKSLHGSETRTLQKVDQKYLENFEMRCWRRMEITWTDRVTNYKE